MPRLIACVASVCRSWCGVTLPIPAASGLMLALLDSLLTAGFDPADQGRRALAWMDGPEYKPGILYDIAIATSQALTRLKRSVPADSAGGREERDNGNGSLMWILLVALVGVGLPSAEVARQ